MAKALEGEVRRAAQGGARVEAEEHVAVDDDKGEKMLDLLEMLNENDDVQNVYANFEVSDAVVAKVSA